jgi:hypothetical protein
LKARASSFTFKQVDPGNHQTNHLNPSSGFGGVARKRNSAPILP